MNKGIVGIVFLSGIVAVLSILVVQPRRLVRVVGGSMSPTYRSGEWLSTLPVNRALRRGDVIVVDSPSGTLIKRVALLPGEKHLQFHSRSGWREMATLFAPHGLKEGFFRYLEVPPGMVYLTGDHLSQSIDSRDFGPLPISRVRRIVEDVRPPRHDSDVVVLKNPLWKSS